MEFQRATWKEQLGLTGLFCYQTITNWTWAACFQFYVVCRFIDWKETWMERLDFVSNSPSMRNPWLIVDFLQHLGYLLLSIHESCSSLVTLFVTRREQCNTVCMNIPDQKRSLTNRKHAVLHTCSNTWRNVCPARIVLFL